MRVGPLVHSKCWCFLTDYYVFISWLYQFIRRRRRVSGNKCTDLRIYSRSSSLAVAVALAVLAVAVALDVTVLNDPLNDPYLTTRNFARMRVSKSCSYKLCTYACFQNCSTRRCMLKWCHLLKYRRFFCYCTPCLNDASAMEYPAMLWVPENEKRAQTI